MAKASGAMGRREGAVQGGDCAPQQSKRTKSRARVAVEGEKTLATRFGDKRAGEASADSIKSVGAFHS